MRTLLFLFATILFFDNAKAQNMPDSTVKHSPLKTLSDAQYNALLNGDDLYNMDLAATLNNYPLPEKAIKYKHELDLSPIQVNKLTAIEKEFHRKKVEMGLTIINNERTLDSLFRYHLLNNGTLIFYTNRYGLYQGELRNVILQACLATRVLLSQQQINKLAALQKADRRNAD
jgi:hypothetical protein